MRRGELKKVVLRDLEVGDEDEDGSEEEEENSRGEDEEGSEEEEQSSQGEDEESSEEEEGSRVSWEEELEDDGVESGATRRKKGGKIFLLGSNCFARLRVWHALYHYETYLKASIRSHLNHEWEHRCAVCLRCPMRDLV